LARCTHVVDLGTQDGPYGVKKQIYLWFELVNEGIDSQRNFTVGRFYTQSLNRKAALRSDLEGWRGKSFTSDELAAFNLAEFAKTPCQVIIGHYQKDDVVRAEIKGISPMPQGASVPAAKAPFFSFDMDSRDKGALDELPDWLRDIVLRAQEWEAPSPKPVPESTDFDDDIPFG